MTMDDRAALDREAMVRWPLTRSEGERVTMISRAATAAIALCIASSANASTILFKSYREPSSEQFRTFNKIYLDGVKEGLLFFNAALQADGKTPYFCLPSKLALTVEQVEEIMMRQAKTVVDPDRVPVSILLLHGLQDTFPCGGSNK
jgi:hypothetical protein